MAKRKIIKINERTCNGCGLCIPNCPEGAIQIIDQKARLISDLFCDGLGACIGHCPQGAITIIEREADGYDERTVMGNIVKQGNNVIAAHLAHLEDHNETGYLKEALAYLKEKKISVKRPQPDHASAGHGHAGCPGSRMMDMRTTAPKAQKVKGASAVESELRQWPVQLSLVSPMAPYLNGADVLIAADCVPFAYADFHRDLLSGKTVLVACPKLDNVEPYREKLAQIFKHAAVKSVTYAHMEVPCCFGLMPVIKEAIAVSGKEIPFEEVTIGIRGEKLA